MFRAKRGSASTARSQPEDEEREKTGLSGKSIVRDLLKGFLFCFGVIFETEFLSVTALPVLELTL